MDPIRRVSVHPTESKIDGIVQATTLAKAATAAAEAQARLSPSLLPSLTYSTATAAPLAPRRHKRDTSVSRTPDTSPPSPQKKPAGAVNLFSSSPFSLAPIGKSRGMEESKHHRARSGSRINPSPAAAVNSTAGLLWRRTKRLLWAFWRRRTVSNLSARLANGLSSLGRHPWGRRLINAGTILLMAVSWFLVIVAVAGPAGGGGGGDGGEKGETDADENPYYRRIIGEVAVGPSLSDPWMVRDINIATADWGLGIGDLSLDDGGGSGGGETEITGDGRVNRVVTGELTPVGGAKTSPKVDLLLTIFSGSTEEDAAKRDLLRTIYDKYEGWIRVGGPNFVAGGANPEKREFSVSVVFVMSKESAPPEGELIGDVLYVPVPEGYRNIVFKTKAMLSLVRHFDFEFLLKADDDSYVCLARIASMLDGLDPKIRGKVYAGVPTACNQSTNPDYWNGRVMKNPDHRWFDSKYVQHTLGGLDCFPAYMQGAFYILAQPLVEHLYRGHEHLECFTNEDVTMGSWLMGVDREVVEIYNLRTSHLWDCQCARPRITLRMRGDQMFYHNCKGLNQLKLCGTRLLRPGVGC